MMPVVSDERASLMSPFTPLTRKVEELDSETRLPAAQYSPTRGPLAEQSASVSHARGPKMKGENEIARHVLAEKKCLNL